MSKKTDKKQTDLKVYNLGDSHKRPKRLPRLNSFTSVRKFNARITRDLYKGEISESLAGKLSYMCSVQCKILELADLKKQIDKLEKKLTEKGA